ncbi:thiamine phosphate synthase [Paludibacterium paludis]|uniref:Thiamine-phosphate synthase n=1 Tax=Paludibacterium paludis TaxID=1225769 RepID=A0A918U8Q5_9NEIS|nr:thiamine phosphate synthase [Paludibacterium paludis]GGY12415.1 thiamine-phosphate synthase [Paludibacterium paludis]
MNGKTERIAGLYAITPDTNDTEKLIRDCAAVLAGGARMLQYRNKGQDETLKLAQAKGLHALCREHGAAFIVNDDITLAKRIGADGVHLGRDDASLAQARRELGPEAILGVSCYNLLMLAQNAAELGADYLAFGAVFPSATKPGAVHAPLELFAEAEKFGLPRVAIGGITEHNAARVIAAGAEAIAVIGGLFDTPDPGLAARAISELFPG